MDIDRHSQRESSGAVCVRDHGMAGHTSLLRNHSCKGHSPACLRKASVLPYCSMASSSCCSLRSRCSRAARWRVAPGQRAGYRPAPACRHASPPPPDAAAGPQQQLVTQQQQTMQFLRHHTHSRAVPLDGVGKHAAVKYVLQAPLCRKTAHDPTRTASETAGQLGPLALFSQANKSSQWPGFARERCIAVLCRQRHTGWSVPPDRSSLCSHTRFCPLSAASAERANSRRYTGSAHRAIVKAAAGG
jgi:hypothetical protein